ncbi:MAG TPA: nicotinate phosphoribosyltransferase [Candidatus Paceibacterota bacterium]|nr:nicotinate phosphoribosyltransferase [Candidatus Paceibacterota bacterium]
MDFAKRAHDHSFHYDWIIRSLLDIDFYKLLMLQCIWLFFPTTVIRFSLMNRTKRVRLANIIDEAQLRAQLDHVRSLSFRENELVWLAGNKFYGKRDIFRPIFIGWLRDLRLPDYQLSRTKDGQWELVFEGTWVEVTLWEIYAIVIVNTLRNRAGLAMMNKSELDIFYALGKARAWEKVKIFREFENLNLTDFGTRRRHEFLWQKWVVELFAEMLGPKNFSGTSNALLAMELGLEAKGTNAHELPMVLAALAYGEHVLESTVLRGEKVRESQYDVLHYWQKTYGDVLTVFLPDTFGTTQFLKNAPEWLASWRGGRPDSKDPFLATEEFAAWWQFHKQDPREKLSLPCDGLDAPVIADLHRKYYGHIGIGYGLGTFGTNDFRGCHPRGLTDLDPISLVCKVSHVFVNGIWIPAVKLSDNYEKATGPKDMVAEYRAIFGTEGVANAPVVV